MVLSFAIQHQANTTTMKRITIAVAALSLCGLGFTSCKNAKADLKKTVVKDCTEGAAKQFTDAKLLGYMKDYCECSGDKISEKLSEKDYMDIKKMEKDGREAEMQTKLLPIIQPCLNEMQTKMQAGMGTGAGH